MTGARRVIGEVDGDARARELKCRLGDDAWVSDEDRDRLLSWLPGEGLRVLEVGCGGGATAAHLARAGHRVTALDVSDVALEIAASHGRRHGLPLALAQGFMEALPFADRAFDAVVCCHTLEHARDARLAAAELERVCGGRLVVIVPRQLPERYTEDYHTVFFPGLTALRGLFRLRERACRLLPGGAALLYVGERADTPIALPASGGWSEMRTAREYEDVLERAHANLLDGDPGAALGLACHAARMAWVLQDDPRFQEDPRLEEILTGVAWSAFGAEASAASMSASPASSGSAGPAPRVGYVISHALDTGGHLRTLLHLLAHRSPGVDARVYSTETADSADTGPEWLAAAEGLGVPLWRARPGDTPIERAGALREALLADRRDVVALFIHPDDAIASVATRFLPGATTAFFHHAANGFTVGASAGDIHVDYLEGLRAHCDACRPLPNRIVLPLPGPDAAAAPGDSTSRAALGIPPGAVVAFTAAPAYKFFRDGDHPYFDALARILREEPRLHHVCIGYAAEAYLGHIEAFARENPDVLARIHFLPRQTSLLPMLRMADLVLDSFPLGGGNVAVEAMSCGTPVVTMRERGPIPEGPWEMVCLESCVARDAEEYVAQALALARDEALRRETGMRLRARYDSHHAPALVARRWEEAFAQWRSAHREMNQAKGVAEARDRFRVSVVLAAGDELAATGETLEALAAHAPEDADYEVVVVDNASRDGTAEWLRALEGDVQVVALDAATSIAGALNSGARRARGAMLLLLASGALPSPGWFEMLARGEPCVAGGLFAFAPRRRFLAARGLAEDAPLDAALADLRIRFERAAGGSGAGALASAVAGGAAPASCRWLRERWAGRVPSDAIATRAVVHCAS